MIRVHKSSEEGFSLVDVLIAMTILMVGILTMGAALTAALVQTSAGESQLRAKSIASATLENVMSARYVKIGGNSYTFDAIQNSGTPPGVFLSTRQPVHELPGPDGLFGTTDDSGAVVSGFERKITITNVNNPNRPSPPNPISERHIEVTVYYKDKGIERDVTIATNVANY